MNRVNTLQQHMKASASESQTSSAPEFTREEILAKRNEGQVWIVIKNNVYNVTDFLDEHPGGAELITDIPADDFKTMTREFDDAEHSEEAMEQLQSLFVGKLAIENAVRPEKNKLPSASDDEEEEEEEEPMVTVAPDPARPFLGLTEVKLKLLDRENLSADVVLFRFALPRASDQFSLTIGKHIVLSFEEMDGKHVSRAYTPVSPNGDQGFVDFLVKLYPTGKMSQFLANLKLGESVLMRGPKGKLGYQGNGHFNIRRRGHNETVQLDHVGMLAGGSGITPMFQIIQHVARNPEDNLRITLIFANRTEADIILRHPLNEFMRMRPKQLRIVYTLDAPPNSGWTGESGFITDKMIKKYLPPPSKTSMIFLCGPPPMIKKACLPALKTLGYPADAIFKF